MEWCLSVREGYAGTMGRKMVCGCQEVERSANCLGFRAVCVAHRWMMSKWCVRVGAFAGSEERPRGSEALRRSRRATKSREAVRPIEGTEI